MKFSELGLNDALLGALDDAGFETPTPIQEKAIPEALGGRDVLGIAQTGTGKTAAFLLPAMHRLAAGRARARMPRMLILEPTRELAAQVGESFDQLAAKTKLSMALLIGGVSFTEQEKKLDRGVDVLVATPGRLLDHFERGKVMLQGVQCLVVDEADRMLDMGFIPDIERIFSLTPPVRQTLFFSATMPPEIQKLTDRFLAGAVKVEVARPATTAETITQGQVRIERADGAAKRAALRALMRQCDDTLTNGIIFCNRKKDVDVVAKSLLKHGFDAGPIHGDLPQAFRMQTLDKFKKGDLKYLIASDVAARGLDIPRVSHVFNFDVPHHPDDYVHRIGRTGRAGREGAAYMLVGPEDDKSLKKILELIKCDIPPIEVANLDEETASAKPDEGRRRAAKPRPTRAPSERTTAENDGSSRRRGKSTGDRDAGSLAKDSWGVAVPSFLTTSVEAYTSSRKGAAA